MLENTLTIILTSVLTCVVLALYIKRNLPKILTDVAVGVSDDIRQGLEETFATPNVKKAFSILGKQSGEVRADAALVDRVAANVVKASPLLDMALKKFGISATEALTLANDPTIGPIIQGFLKGGTESFISGQGGTSTISKSVFGV